jgi:pre-rRNA-processing protein TSR3
MQHCCCYDPKMNDLPTLIIRHRKENLKKCSLQGLETRNDFVFLSFPLSELPNIDQYLLLSLNAPVLTKEDAKYGLILLDATWKYASIMEKKISFPSDLPRRSLPPWQTAYPRRQNDCPDPLRGLASLEALFAAFFITGRMTNGLLDRYYWKNQFLEKNKLIYS